MKRKRLTEIHRKRISESLRNRRKRKPPKEYQLSRTQKFNDIANGVNRLVSAGAIASRAFDSRRYTNARVRELSNRSLNRNVRLISDIVL